MLTYTEMTEQIREEGMQKGWQGGMREGIQKGRQEGTSETLHTLARNMVAEGLAIEAIVRMTGLSEQDVQTLSQ